MRLCRGRPVHTGQVFSGSVLSLQAAGRPGSGGLLLRCGPEQAGVWVGASGTVLQAGASGTHHRPSSGSSSRVCGMFPSNYQTLGPDASPSLSVGVAPTSCRVGGLGGLASPRLREARAVWFRSVPPIAEDAGARRKDVADSEDFSPPAPPWLQADRPHRLPTDRAAQPHPGPVLGSPGCELCLHTHHAAFGAAAGDGRTAPQSPDKGCTGPGTSAGSQLPPLGPGERGGRRHTLARTRGGPRSAYAQRPSGFTRTGSSFLKSQTRDGKIRGPDHLDWGPYAREQGYEAEFSRDGDGGQAAL